MNTIIIIDNHRLFTSGFELLLGTIPGENIVQCFDDLDSAMCDVKQHDTHPSLFIAEYMLPGHCGYRLIESLQDLCPQVPVMIISAEEKKKHQKQAMQAGASDFFYKSCSPTSLLKAVGELLCSESANEDEKINLTARQKEVLCLASKGFSNKEIARFLGLSPETIKSHLAAVFSRLGVLNRIEALDFARCNGILALS